MRHVNLATQITRQAGKGAIKTLYYSAILASAQSSKLDVIVISMGIGCLPSPSFFPQESYRSGNRLTVKENKVPSCSWGFCTKH